MVGHGSLSCVIWGNGVKSRFICISVTCIFKDIAFKADVEIYLEIGAPVLISPRDGAIPCIVCASAIVEDPIGTGEMEF